jgi:hypothetical protein
MDQSGALLEVYTFTIGGHCTASFEDASLVSNSYKGVQDALCPRPSVESHAAAGKPNLRRSSSLNASIVTALSRSVM